MQLQETVTLAVENVGGIDRTQVEFSPGVTVLAGRNATNRTSLLQSLMAALGSERVSLKADADEGRVELDLGEETYVRTLERRGERVATGGSPYLPDPELADLFAFLLRTNEARRAVERHEDLRDLIMRPIDTAEIQRAIEKLREERSRIDDELDRLADLEDERTGLVGRRTELEATVEERREELREKEAEIDERDAVVSEAREEQAQLEETLNQLQETRSELEDVRYSLETERESIESLREERAELESELADLPESPADGTDEIERRLDRLRGRRSELDTTINELQNVIQFNEETLAEDRGEVFEALADDEGDLTDQLVVDASTVKCWTCGSEVDRERIEATLDQLRSLRKSKFERRSEIKDEIDERQSELRRQERTQRRRDDLAGSLETVEAEIDEREERVERLKAERAELAETAEDLEATVESRREDSYGEVLDLHKEANQLEFELERAQDELEELGERLDELEAKLAEREELKDRREAIDDELEELRTRVDRIEAEAVEAFNTHMENVLETLGYENIARIWIERTERTVREGRRKVEERAFELHVVRTTEEGVDYRDSVDNLSESEREVTGLVFALAGYLVHEVYEDVPFVLLDSLESIDSGRIAALVDYLADYADNLVVALLPEDAAALSDDYQRVTSI